MSVLATSWVWSLDLPTSAKFVALALADYADEEGRCWPKVASLAKKCNLSPRRVRELISDLEAAGVLGRQMRSANTGSSVSSLYVLAIPEEVVLRRGRVRPVAGGGCDLSQGGGATQFTPSEPSVEPSVEPEEKNPPQSPQGDGSGWSPLRVEIPPELDHPDFREAWALWVQHRKEIRKRLTPTSVASQLKRLAAWGRIRAVRALEHTIAQGWTGIREPDPLPGESRRSPSAVADEYPDADELIAERERQQAAASEKPN